MNRKDEFNIVAVAFRQCHRIPWDTKPIDVVKDLHEWRRKNGYPQITEDMVEVVNGCMVISGKVVTRLEPLERVPFSEKAYYWEGRCLAKAELW